MDVKIGRDRFLAMMGAFALCVLLTFLAVVQAETSTINSTNKWAWAANAGWLNCRVNDTNGAVIGQFYCQGYLYSESSGWISLGDGTPTNGIYYSNSNSADYGVNHDGEGHLTGYAWCESTGWMNFEWTNKEHASSPRIDLRTGILSGYVWGDALGWVSLSNLSAYLETDAMSEGTSADGDEIPDAWEMAQMGSTNLGLLGATATNDYDGDGVTDYNEYLAGTSPTNANDYLYMSAVVVTNSTNLVLTWVSEGSRSYKIEKNDKLTNSAGWADTGLGIFSPATGQTTSVSLPINSSTDFFYRVRAVLPLSQ